MNEALLTQADTVQANLSTSSAGTLVAAALETSGYHAQELVLTQFSQVLNSIAALIFLGSIFGAVMTIALMGKYKTAIWFFIGPVMFYSFRRLSSFC